MMKTRAFKKAISVVCVLAMLLSLCVVSFVGTASAAETEYTLNNNGVVTTVNLAAGDALPTPTAPVDGVTFLGWYDDINFTNKVEVAGDDTALYAKYNATIATFDYTDTALKGVYDPNGKFGAAGIGAYKIETDPADANNKVLYTDTIFSAKNTVNTCIESYPGSGDGYKLVADTKYVISFKYKATKGTQPSDDGIKFSLYASAAAGIGQASNKTPITPKYGQYTDTWTEMELVMSARTAAQVEQYPYLLLVTGDGNNDRGTVYIDDIVIKPVTDQNYTLYNEGVKEVKTATPGTALPTVANANFLGWYDESLTTKYETYPDDVTTLIAKYDGVVIDFDNPSLYKPNTGNNFYMSETVDPLDANNKVMALTTASSGNNMHFAPAGAMYATDGLKLEPGKVYEVKFEYYATNVGTVGTSLSTRASSQAGVGVYVAGAKTDTMSQFKVTSNTTGWKKGSMTFTFNGTEDKPYFIFLAQDDSDRTATVYIDNVVIKPYVAKVITEDFEMDFEDVEGEGFQWSEDVNDYTYNSGNGYVTRGEIVSNDAETNKYFKLMHFKKKNGNHYFTVNNGVDQFNMTEGGIYTVEFDYFVEHSETSTELRLYYVNAQSAAVNSLTTLDEFIYRDDDATLGWAHAEYTFIASDVGTYTSLGIGLWNGTNCPEEYATSVLFDNVVVKTHSVTGDDAIIIFDSMGGTDCDSMTVEVGDAPATLPAPTKYGYDFAGWKYDVTTGEGEEAVTKSYELTTSTEIPDGIMNAYATWTLTDGVVELGFRTNVEEYDANVGTIVAFPGQPIQNMPADPEYDNQRFVGWYLDRNFSKALDVNSAPSESLTLFAKWETDGIVIDYEDYTLTSAGQKSDRYKLITEENGNKTLSHSLTYGTNKDASAVARAMFQDDGKVIRAYEGAPYVVTFKYKIEDYKSQGKFYIFLSSATNTWGDYKAQTGSISFTDNTDGWAVGTIEFTATPNADATKAADYMSIGCSGDATIYIDDVVISCPENDMNIYGSAIRFNVNGGKTLNAISGDEGDTVKLPTPYKAGYKFVGWYKDSSFETPFTDTTFGTEPILLHAKWQLGKFEESFEDYPASVQSLGVAASYTFYTSTAVGYDSSNIRTGNFSLFRNGASAGVKAFTLMRSGDYALDIGETYTVSFWVKPTAISNDTGAISLMNMTTFTGLSGASEQGVIVNFSDLKEGEWQQISYTFVAETQFVAIGTPAGCDMYFDDITVTLKGYTGSAPTGDTSVSPIIILAIIVLSAGALLVTGKKVFAK